MRDSSSGSRPRWPGYRPATWTRSVVPRMRSANRCGSRPSRKRCGTRSPSDTPCSARIRRRSRSARARSARTARRRRSPASRRRTCGSAGPSTSATRYATAGSSLYSPTAISYRARLGEADEPPAMGVTVQLMVDADVSGVMFTCNPVSGDPSMVAINASWGLGLAVVGGEVTPDDYLVSKVTGEVVREHVHAKQIEYVPDSSGARRGARRGAARASRTRVPRSDRAGEAGRSRKARRAALRLPPGHRVGDGPRRRRIVRRAGAPRHRAGQEAGQADGGVGDVADHEHVRRRPRRRTDDGADRRRRPRDPPDHRRIGPRRAANRDRGLLASRPQGWRGCRGVRPPSGSAASRRAMRTDARRAARTPRHPPPPLGTSPTGCSRSRPRCWGRSIAPRRPACRRSSRSASASSRTRSCASSR